MSPEQLRSAARAWRDEDPDAETQAELDYLLASDDIAGLADRFDARLEFGTAGLRGEMGAGPNRMNRAVVIRATAGLAAYLADQGHVGEPVLVGYDARHRSAMFAADAAAVLAAAGFEARLSDRPVPTPVVALGVRHYGCCAGIQVTASHNPPRDNGYKVYLGDGAQIIPPADDEISKRIEAVGALDSVPRAGPDDPKLSPVGEELIEAYLAGVVAAFAESSSPHRDVRVAYTPLHGVGGQVLLEAFARAGFPRPSVVQEQAAPDPDFPTLAYPNPVDPRTLDLAVELGRSQGADVVLVNDPDADRLAVAVPDDEGWRRLTGDEIGILLADWLLSQGHGSDRLVVTTIVSSSMLGRLAEARGVAFAETLTGFKWIVRPALDRPDLRLVYAYEEAMGSCVGTLVRDKDGISAALAFADLVAAERARGRRLIERLDDLACELGVHATSQRSIPLTGAAGLAQAGRAVDRLVTSPPAALAGRAITGVEDLRRGERLPPTDGVVLRGDGVRLIVRPSGTEPVLKCYAEAVVPVPNRAELAAARQLGTALADAILSEIETLAAP